MLKELDQMESQNHMRRVQILCHEVTATHTQIPAQPSTRVQTGFSPGVTFGGSGEAPISWTSIPDIGRFVAHVLTALPKNDLEWRTFRIEGDRHVRFRHISMHIDVY